MIPVPGECHECSDDNRRTYGCPVEWGFPWETETGGKGFGGESEVVWYRDQKKHLSEAEEWERTCPQFFARSPFFLSLWAKLDDYEKGRIDLRELSAAEHTYLRVLLEEHTAWTNYWDAKLMPDPPSKGVH